MVRFLNLIASEPDIARADHDRLVEVGRDRGGPEVRAGKAIVNSISLKEGEDAFRHHAHLIRRRARRPS